VDEAVTTLTRVAEYGVFLAEDPVNVDLDVYRDTLKPKLNAAGVKLMLDEKVRDTATFIEIVNSGASNVVNYHANWHSGFAGGLSRSSFVDMLGLENYIGSSIYLGIADAANILLASITPRLIACEQVRGSDFYTSDSVVNDFYPLADGRYHIPDLPGLGITVDRQSLDALTVKKEIIR
jgi:L-alanine-DL-glutamate epimerase-like enolase superfamily enzyme